MKKSILATIPLILLAGCSIVPLNFSPSNVGLSQTKQNSALISTTVTLASNGEAKGQILIAGAESNIAEMWKVALDDSIVRMGLFRDDAPHRLSLVVKVFKLDFSTWGYEFYTIARYELIDRNTGDIVFTSDIETKGHASDFVGVNRVRNAANWSVQNNIATFLQQVETADLTKPVFPANKQAIAK